ncbi:uncharacterized protein LOC109602179 [Aethina tumida]|uniref:uncharacterized protein LOC109602179 n=1 Tax=Aethina tumida TaxID=116153 RepID=UPI00096B417C|nr:uncharacterized protein LOC109602179 [Aethina tumida]
MFRVLLVLVLAHYSICAFFDLTDVDDPLSLLWNNRPTFGKQRSECTTNTPVGLKHGVCQNPSLCMLSGGKPNGICGVLSTCCTYESSCGKVTSQKVSYFQRSNVDQNSRECKYEVVLLNPNVCQVRLDFEHFNLAPAIERGNASRCDSDRLLIYPNIYNIPELCGNNDNQHVYVHINQTTGTKKLVLDMITLSNKSPSWKIKITQLECPGILNTDDMASDFNLLAPLGAIQYHTNVNGELKSFGYDTNRNLNSYTSNENYAIAFKRTASVCGIKFRINYFNLPDDNSTEIKDKMCTSDYLFIPYIQFLGTTHDVIAKLCSNKYEKDETFVSQSPGPLTVYFKSSPNFVRANGTGPNAFYITYEMLTFCN